MNNSPYLDKPTLSERERRLADALRIVLTQLGPYRDGDGAAKYHAINIGERALTELDR